MKIEIGKNTKQKEGFAAFVLHTFPPKGIFELPMSILVKAAEADRYLSSIP